MDWERLKEIAFGPLNLMPDQFWSLTFQEFKELADGYNKRQELEWRKIAQHASWTTAPHVKKPISVDKLLGKNKVPKEQRKTTPEKTKQEMDSLMSDFGVDE